MDTNAENEHKQTALQNSFGGLKPVLDGIFAEVQANIPTLDFDDNSDEEDEQVHVFSRGQLPSIQSSSDGEEIVEEVAETHHAVNSLPSLVGGEDESQNQQTSGYAKSSSDERWANRRRQLPDDLPSTPFAANSVHLNLGELANLDLEELLVQLNLGQSRDIESLMADESDGNNNASDHQNDSITLMEELTMLSQKQLADSAPPPKLLLPSTLSHRQRRESSHAAAESDIRKANLSVPIVNSPLVAGLSQLAPSHTQVASCGTGTDDDHENGLSSIDEADVSCGTSDLCVSRGVSAAFGDPKSVDSWRDIAADEGGSSTVFLDLRTEITKEIQHDPGIPHLLQRLPHFTGPHDCDSSDSSSSEDEFEWAAARRAIKQCGLKVEVEQQRPLSVDEREESQVTGDSKQLAMDHSKTVDDKKTVDQNASASKHKQTNAQATTGKASTVRENTFTTPNQAKLEQQAQIHVLHLAEQGKSERVTKSVGTESCRENTKDNIFYRKTPILKTSSHQAVTLLNGSTIDQGNVAVVDLEEPSEEERIQRNKKELERYKQQQEQERAKRQRLQKSLENLRPSSSSGGRHKAAPGTPVLFDQEASYEVAPASLPEAVAGRSYLLLSTKLSTCGELASVRGGSKAVPNGDTHVYSTLLAWLLSIVPCSDRDNARDYAQVCGAPFHVIGLQQSWHEAQLVIEVGIMSRDAPEVPGTGQSLSRGRYNNNNRGGGNFKGSVNKFLTTNSLHSVFSKMANCGAKALNQSCLNQITINQRNLATYLHVNPDPKAMTRVFDTDLAFFWQTAELYETSEVPPSIPPAGPSIDNTVMLMEHAVYHEPFCMLDVLWRVWRHGLDVAGLRLLYNVSAHPSEENTGFPVNNGPVSPRKTHSSILVAESYNPLVAIGIRGPNALHIWLEEVGPQDPYLACRTDPNSLRAMYSSGQASKEDCLFYCPRSADRASTELARWFGGRVPASGVINIGSNEGIPLSPDTTKTNPSGRRLPTSSLHSSTPRPPAMLVSTTDTQLFLLISPVVPVRCIGHVLNMCCTRGFSVQGVRRTRLNGRRISCVGFTQAQLAVFCPKSSPAGSPGHSPAYALNSPSSKPMFDFESQNWRLAPAVASTVLWLNKENGCHHAASLVELVTLELKTFGYLPDYICNKDQMFATQLCFLPVPYSEAVLKHLGGDFSHVPDAAIYSPTLFRHSFYTNPELEQVCVVTLLKEQATRYGGDVLNHLLLEKPLSGSGAGGAGGAYCGFELLGLKLLPHLSTHQAKEFTPFEVGTTAWHSSLQTLTSGPALMCALRGVDAFSRLQDFIHSYTCIRGKVQPSSKQQSCPHLIMSTTPELSYRQLSVMLHERELFSDQSARRDLEYLPPPRRTLSSGQSSSNESLNGSESNGTRRAKRKKTTNAPQRGLVNGTLGGLETVSSEEAPLLQSLLNGPRPITTVAIIKPEATEKPLGRVLRRFAQEGFSVVAMRMENLEKEVAMALCQDRQAADKDSNDIDKRVNHIMSGPVVITCLQRENSVKHLLDILGPLDPRTARQESQFLLRGCFGVDEIRNGLYGSVTYDTAVRDQRLLFPGGLCCRATVDLRAEGIPCLAVDEIFNTSANRAVVKSTHPDTGHEDTQHLSLLSSSLLEINCVLLQPPLVKSDSSHGRHKNSAFTEVIYGLVSQAGFRVVGLRMVLLSQPQAEQCVGLYQVPLENKPHVIASELTKGPSVVLALLRDNAVTCFDMLLGSSGKRDSLSTKYGKHILAARTTKQAHRLLECFFDKLMPNPKAEIHHNN